MLINVHCNIGLRSNYNYMVVELFEHLSLFSVKSITFMFT